MELFDNSLWEEKMKVDELELKGLSVTINKNRKGSRNGRMIIYLNPIEVKGNRELLSKLLNNGWYAYSNPIVEGKRVRLFEKTY